MSLCSTVRRLARSSASGILVFISFLTACKSSSDAPASPEPETPSIPSNYTAEATVNLQRIHQGAMAYYQREVVSPSGDISPSQFPRSTPLTPRQVPCVQGVTPEPGWWDAPTWQALDFAAMEGPLRYAYQFDSSGSGRSARFTAWAFGDLDCDRVLSTFRRTGSVDGEGNVVYDSETIDGNE